MDILTAGLIGSSALNVFFTLDVLSRVIKTDATEVLKVVDAKLSEANRRFALVMSKLNIKDEVTEHVEALLKIRLQEAKDQVAKIDALVEARKAAFTGDLKKIEDGFLSKVDVVKNEVEAAVKSV